MDNSYSVEKIGDKYYAIRNRDGCYLAVERSEALVRKQAEQTKDKLP